MPEKERPLKQKSTFFYIRLPLVRPDYRTMADAAMRSHEGTVCGLGSMIFFLKF